ncbi:MAG TPA: DUF4129 domain-containing protein [Alphaproteobacteria bacterium]|nr:DUF4129 domain-containing protein [Alphaproteobacteria bacterium]
MRPIPVAASLRCLAFAVLLGCLLPPAAAAQQGDLHEEADEILSQGDIQRDAPLAEQARSQAQDVAQDPTLQHNPPPPVADAPPKPLPLPIPGNLFLYVLIGTLAVCACLVLYHLIRTYAPGRRAWSKADQAVMLEIAAIPAPGEAPLPPLDEIERLARAGAYAEAIHLMLLRALETLRRRLGTSWAKSLTSREIVRRSELPGTDRQALKVLVGAVEICRFGGQQANEQIYRACLDHYRSIGGDAQGVPA